jgi:hypothetical protein
MPNDTGTIRIDIEIENHAAPGRRRSLRNVVLGVTLCTGVSIPAAAQAARVGRLPLLAPLSSGAGRCESHAASAEMQRSSMARVLDVKDTIAHRLLGLVVDSTNRWVMFQALMHARDRRRSEGESVTAFFTSRGTVAHGSRLAFTTGVPARTSDDRRAGLLPADTAQVKVLAAEIVELCRAHVRRMTVPSARLQSPSNSVRIKAFDQLQAWAYDGGQHRDRPSTSFLADSAKAWLTKHPATP